MRLWGRVNSVNVQKVLWCLEELRLPCERIDAGMEHGVVNTEDYRAMNPNGRVPCLQDGELVLWESNTILRYLCEAYPSTGRALYPHDPALRARISRWLDWQLSTLTPAERPLFWGMVRTKPERRDAAAIAAAAQQSGECWRIVEAQLLGHRRPYIEGNDFTLADLVLGAFARRWFGIAVPDRPSLPALDAWYARVSARPGFIRVCAPPLS